MQLKTKDQSFTILVEGAPYGTEASSLAYLFSQSVLKEHSIRGIFFYMEGIFNANRYTSPANDEFDLVVAWSELATKYNFPLLICEAAAQRRGVVPENLAYGFKIGTLSDFIELSSHSDKTVQFK